MGDEGNIIGKYFFPSVSFVFNFAYGVTHFNNESKEDPGHKACKHSERPSAWETGFPPVDAQVQVRVPRQVQRCRINEVETLKYIY